MATIPSVTPNADSGISSRYWVIPVYRAIIAAIVAVAITFSADHSATFGLVLFGTLALVDGLILTFLAPARSPRVIAGSTRLQGVIGIAAAVAAGIVVLVVPSGRLGAYILIVVIWAVLTGVLEFVSGLRSKGTSAPRRDLFFIGGLTVVLAIAFLLVPPELHQPYGGRENIQGALTADILTVGLFGAYAAISAVYQAIGGASLRWDRTDSAAQAAPTTEALSS